MELRKDYMLYTKISMESKGELEQVLKANSLEYKLIKKGEELNYQFSRRLKREEILELTLCLVRIEADYWTFS